jgi:hypothetical protein
MGTSDENRRPPLRRGGRPGGGLRAALGLSFCVLVLGALACGDTTSTDNANRPPAPINISVQIGAQRVTVSPAKFGAGPITLLIANQSGASQTLTIDGPRVRQSIGPINPEDTATLKVTVQPGEYALSVEEASGLRPARLTVGPKRPSAENQLLLP